MNLYQWISLFTEIFNESQKGISSEFETVTY